MAKVGGASSRVKRRSGLATARSAGPKSIGTKRTASAGGDSRSSDFSTSRKVLVCIDPAGHEDLQSRRIYERLPDPSAARSRFVRVIDDSGEDYLYPESCFVAVDLPRAVRVALGVVA